MSFKSKPTRSPAAFGLLISTLVFMSVAGLRYAGMLQMLELSAYDCYVRYRPHVQKQDPGIVLVTISEEDIRQLAQWPISDDTMAELLENILEDNPRGIGMDIYRDIPVQPGRERLGRVFSEHGRLVLVRKLGDETTSGVPPPYAATEDNLVGFNDLLVDPDGIVRRGLLFMDDGQTSYYSFDLLLTLLYLEKEGISPGMDPSNPQWLRLGKTTFAPLEKNDGGYVGMDARGYQFLLDFSRAGASFSSFSIVDVLSKRTPGEAFRDKLVIIGSVAESTNDFFFVPVAGSQGFHNRLWGLELHAGIVSQLIGAALYGDAPMGFISEGYEWAWILLWCLIGYALSLRIRSLPWFVLMNLCAVAALIFIAFLAFGKGFWVPMAPPALACLMSAAAVTAYMSHQEKAQKALLMQLFSSHVSRDVAEAMWAERDRFMDGGRPRSQNLVATVLFTDLKGFTPIAENMEAGALMDWLNEYMGAMARQVVNNRGVVNKYIGDAVMAVFGIPVARKTEEEISRDAVNAVTCALGMGQDLERLNRAWLDQGRTTVKMRVGIHTGPLVVGCVGSTQRLEYTVIGDTVNIASRLESFDKEAASESVCRILVGEETWQRLGQGFACKKLTSVPLKGKMQEVTIYQVLGK